MATTILLTDDNKTKASQETEKIINENKSVDVLSVSFNAPQ